MSQMELNAFELKVLECIRNSKNPAKALEIAIDLLTRLLNDREGRA